MGLEVLAPDVNESFHEFAVVPGKDQIRFGLDAVKNVGHGAVDEILRAREQLEGRFSSLEDFCKNVNPSIVNRKAMESLVKAGAFDSFGDRSIIYNNLDNILSFAGKIQRDSLSGQVDLFGESDVVSELALRLVLDESGPRFSQHEQLVWERELLGLYLSHNPLRSFEAYLQAETVPIAKLSRTMDGRAVTLGGSISDVREITTKNGSKMAFVKIEDLSGQIELIFFPKIYQTAHEILSRDQIITVRGKLDSGRGAQGGSELKLLAEEVQVVTEQMAKDYKLKPAKTDERQRLYIRLEDSSDQNLLLSLKQKLDGHSGETEVVLVTGPKDGKQIIKLPQTIDVNETSIRELAGLFGSANVVVR